MRVAVLGAGIQGVCIALELARRGASVDLYDQAASCLTGASLHNEGKLHLGYVYAADPTLRTAELMMKGSLSFSAILRRWIGDEVYGIPVSQPFRYLVHRESQLDPDTVADFFLQVHEGCLRELSSGAGDYFGRSLCNPPARFRTVDEAGFDPARIAAAFATEEIAVDPHAVAEALRLRVAATPGIVTRFRTRVLGVCRDKGFRVEAIRDGAAVSETYDQVVNALWEGRLAVDRTMGLEPERPWLLRYKEYLKLQLPETARDLCATIILGAFGDIVSYPSGSAYLSWYPSGRRISTPSLLPPDESGLRASRDALEVKTRTMDALAEIAPFLRDLSDGALEDARLRGGWIFAWGNSDIDDPASQLHERHEVGPSSHSGYHTVDTGKYCLAPMFALRVADAVKPV